MKRAEAQPRNVANRLAGHSAAAGPLQAPRSRDGFVAPEPQVPGRRSLELAWL